MVKHLSSWLMIGILANSCAASRVVPASMPASMETGGAELVQQGEKARADGVFFTIPAFRDNLLTMRLREIDLNEQIAESNLQRDAADKKVVAENWCLRWCLPIGLIVGTFTGGAFGIWAGSKK